MSSASHAVSIIEGPYLNDILEQPAALRRFAAGLLPQPGIEALGVAVRAGQYRRVVLTGMGSSLYALYPLYLRLIAAGLTVHQVETAELIYYQSALLTPETLVVAVSQSGRSGETVSLLPMIAGKCTLIGVTNDRDSPLEAVANEALSLHAGPESTVSCKTYLNTLCALLVLGDYLLGETADRKVQIGKLAKEVEAYLDNWRSHVETLADELNGVRQVYVTGRGPSVATAETGGLILKESTRQPCEGMSAPAFRHGPFEVLGPDVFVAVIGGDAVARPFNDKLMADMAPTGARFRLIATDSGFTPFRLPACDNAFTPVLEMLPVQMLSLALSALHGREAGRFERAAKITSQE